MLEVQGWPRLRDPVLVLALGGWVDAGAAGGGAATTVTAQLASPRQFASYDVADVVDLQQARPLVRRTEGEREIVWPSIGAIAGHLGCDVVVVAGPEPSLRWHAFADDVAELAQRVGVALVVGLAGMPAVVSHRRSVQVLATASDADLARQVGAVRGDYHGPTGIQTVLQVVLGESGIPGLALWAQVPHYLAAAPSPPAVVALLARLAEVSGITADLSDLDDASAAYLAQVEETLGERPDLVEMVDAIEQREADAEDVLWSGEAIAEEIERFLRDQP